MKRSCTLLIAGLFLAWLSPARAGEELKFQAELSGAQEVPEVVTTTTGEIEVEFDEAFTQAEFELNVFNGVGVTQAHFHCGRPGVNGPIIFFLFGLVPGGINVNGQLSSDVLTNADFTGADCVPIIGRPVNNIASLAFAMRDGLIYTNVHTLAHPGGEVRGQLLEERSSKDKDNNRKKTRK
jgi:hypothetical protein